MHFQRLFLKGKKQIDNLFFFSSTQNYRCSSDDFISITEKYTYKNLAH